MRFPLLCGIFAQKEKLRHLVPAELRVFQQRAERGVLVFLNSVPALEYSALLIVL